MAAWLDLSRDDAAGWSLVDTGRIDDIVQSMSHPATQYPSVLSFLGNESRVAALRALFPQNNVTRRGPAGLVRLHLSTTTANTEHPVWFTETSFARPPTVDRSSIASTADRSRRYPVRQGRFETPCDIKDHLLTRLVFPWTHVACFFADGENELKALTNWLAATHGDNHASPSDTPSPVRVILILTDPTAIYNADPVEAGLPGSDVAGEQRPTISVLDLRDRHQLSPSALYAPLQRLLLDGLQDSRAERIQQGLLFSAVHLKFMWHRCLAQSLLHPAARINCLSLARERLPVPFAFHDGLAELLGEACKIGCPIHDLCQFVASALLMDAYPPGMHRFRPQHVFDSLYRDLWLTAPNLDEGPDWAQNGNAIRDAFVNSFAHMGPLRTSLTIRREALRYFGAQWPDLTLPTMCLFCLGRPAEHKLPCRHALCDTCVVIFGRPTRGAEYHQDLSQCPLCQDVVECTVRLLPPTKRPVVLALDGGGIRGIITLGLLQELERRLAGSIVLSDIPDLTAGVSVGAFIGTDIVHNSISAAEAYRKFPGFARKVFPTSGIPLGRWPWLRVVIGLYNDSLYDAAALDQTIRTVCGPTRRVFDAGATSVGGRRLAVVVSRTSDGKPVVFPNYRGVERMGIDSGYQVMLRPDGTQNPLLSDVLGCSVAAPGFFRSKLLPGLGPFQDGGIRANNPHGIAQAECRRVWPSARTHDLLVSVGTGYIPSTADSNTSPSHAGRSLHDTAPLRLWRAYCSSPCMDGTAAYKEGLNHVPHAMRFRTFRLDHALDGNLPRLDDVGQLAALTSRSYRVTDELVRAVLATCFFFELDEAPTLIRGEYYCRGSILCARRQARRIMERVLVEFPGAEACTLRGDGLGRVGEDDGCTVCGYYRKRVRFPVGSLDEEVTILFTGSSHQHPIGGFPATVQQFLHRQQADAVFGRSDHQTDRWPPRRRCYCARGTKRVQFQEPPPERKKRRL